MSGAMGGAMGGPMGGAMGGPMGGAMGGPMGGAMGMGGSRVPFNDRFKPSSEMPESMYSLAHSVETEVQRQLSGEQEVAAGTPLTEALAYKGISQRASSISSASGGEALGSESPSFMSPRHEPTSELSSSQQQNLYSPIPKKGGASTIAGGGGGGGGVLMGGGSKPVPKPRAGTHNPLSPSNSLPGAFPADSHPRAETLANGYMRPQPVKRVGNYDQLPPGPPRPATQTAPSPKQHRSALLRNLGGQAESSSSTAAGVAGGGGGGHTYINMKQMSDNVPPAVDRRNKPAQPSPPRVDRLLKPRGGDRVSNSSDTSSNSSDSPPMFPARTTSLANTEPQHQQHPSNMDEGLMPPNFPTRTTSLGHAATSLEASGSFAGTDFMPQDLPRPSPRTTQYTQVEFDPTTGKHSITDLALSADIARLDLQQQQGQGDLKRGPLPAPRSTVGRVNYTDVDLMATDALRGQQQQQQVLQGQVTLGEAEQLALKDKPYVNVKKEGGKVDEETDPGYYTHMRVCVGGREGGREREKILW